MKSIMIKILISIISLFAGVFIGAKYLGEGQAIAMACLMGDAAIKEGILTKKQYLLLSESTGKQIQSRYPWLAKNIALSPKAIKRASEFSDCSQILVSLSKGLEHK